MYELKVVTGFSAAHTLTPAGARPPHGHNFKVEVILKVRDPAPGSPQTVDIREVDRVINQVVSGVDHTYLNELPPFATVPPSIERLAQWFYEELSRAINSESVQVGKINLWDSDRYCAIYFEK